MVILLIYPREKFYSANNYSIEGDGSFVYLNFIFFSLSVGNNTNIDREIVSVQHEKKKKGNKKRRMLGRDDKIARDNWFGESFGKASMRMAPIRSSTSPGAIIDQAAPRFPYPAVSFTNLSRNGEHWRGTEVD